METDPKYVGEAAREILAGSLNTARKIEALWKLGLRNSEIARLLGVTDQYVSAVRGRLGLRTSRASSTIREARTAYVAPEQGAWKGSFVSGSAKVGFARVDEQGRVEIPAHLREVLGFEPGRKLQLRLDGTSLRIVTMTEALKEVQSYFKSILPEGVSLVDELLAERRQEAAREEED